MADVLKKVKSGDPLKIPAQTFNTFIEVAQDYQARRFNTGQFPQRDFSQSGIVLVKNSTIYDCDRFGVLGINGPVFSPTDNLEGFKNKVVLTGSAPSEGSNFGNFVITQEPIRSGQIGSAWIAGVCPVQIDMVSGSHKFADVADGDSTVLRSGFSGAAQIVWVESGTGIKWAIVQIGLPVTQVLNHHVARLCLPKFGQGDDFTDNRYWIEELYITNDTWGPKDPIIWADKPGGLNVVATNLQEHLSQSHDLPHGSTSYATVIVYKQYDQYPYFKYYFNGPGIIVG